jgi:hypothetical protein
VAKLTPAAGTKQCARRLASGVVVPRLRRPLHRRCVAGMKNIRASPRRPRAAGCACTCCGKQLKTSPHCFQSSMVACSSPRLRWLAATPRRSTRQARALRHDAKLHVIRSHLKSYKRVVCPLSARRHARGALHADSTATTQRYTDDVQGGTQTDLGGCVPGGVAACPAASAGCERCAHNRTCAHHTSPAPATAAASPSRRARSSAQVLARRFTTASRTRRAWGACRVGVTDDVAAGTNAVALTSSPAAPLLLRRTRLGP